MKYILLVAVLLFSRLTSTYSECTTSRGVLGACLIVTGNFDINNCTECITSNLPAASAANTTATTAAQAATATAGNGSTVTDEQCDAMNDLLCDTTESCSEACAGSFCSGAFTELLECEAAYYVPDCTNLTTDRCDVPADNGNESGAYAVVSFFWNSVVMACLLGTSMLLSLLS